MSSHDPPIILAKVDASDEKNKVLGKEFEIKGFPTIKIFRNGGKNIQEYKGTRDANGIVAYLKKQSGPASFEIKSVEDASGLIDDNRIVIVRAFCIFVYCFHPHLLLKILIKDIYLHGILGWGVPRVLRREV